MGCGGVPVELADRTTTMLENRGNGVSKNLKLEYENLHADHTYQ